MTTQDLIQPETHRFQAEVTQLLDLVIHSLYSHKEVFLRELVSNAADALDKLRFRAITEPELLGGDPTLEIRVVADRDAGTITIEDTGIGMTREELAKNLGTIAHSGSKAFLEALQAGARSEVNLIGQFGVGFYSAFLVADRVEVVSRAAGQERAYRWTSDARETFTIEPAERPSRGTSVVLHLKEDQRHFLEEWELRRLVARYSDYVSHPIKVRAGKATAQAGPAEGDVVNRGSALWQRPRSEISAEQYNEFYKHLTHDHEPPLAWTHFKVEGTQQFTGLIFLPRHRPLFDLDPARRGVRLFVKRVFVMEDCEELVPTWLRFVRGVVDSDDLPLNVSREVLQDSSVVRAIRKQLVKRTLDLIEEVARDRPEDYERFWREFGAVLKEGIVTDSEQRERLARLARWESSRDAGLTSLQDYVARMPEGQKAIYYVFGESRAALASSPHLEALRARGYEVLYMTDPVDEFAADALREYEGRPLVSAMRADLKLEGEPGKRAEADAQQSELAPLLARIKNVLGDKVKDVRPSDRLTDSPCCLVVPEGAHHAYMERLLRANGRTVSPAPRTLEVNARHPLIEALRTLHTKAPDSPRVAEWIEMLYDQALLTEGSRVEDPNRFARRVVALMAQAATAAAAEQSAS